MNKVNKIKNNIGLTPIELLVVVVILGIFAALAIPRYVYLLKKTREGVTKANLGSIRSAIVVYYCDKEGKWPDDLTSNFSSYMNYIPPAKATQLGDSNSVTNVLDVPSTTGTGWAYCVTGKNNGLIWCNSTATDSDGKSFTTY